MAHERSRYLIRSNVADGSLAPFLQKASYFRSTPNFRHVTALR